MNTPRPTTIQTPSWANNMADLRREHGYEPLQIEGAIPLDLTGTLFRNGPGRFSMPDGPNQTRPIQHWFDGIGAITGVRFANGSASGAVRVVQPCSLAGERADGVRRQWGFGTAPSGAWRRLKRQSRNSANTNVLGMDGRLFALYEANLPTEISLDDLTTIGETNFNGTIPHCFSAHPHRVDARKTTYNFGVRWALRPVLDVFAIPDGKPPERIQSIPLDGIPLLHDCIASEKYLIFLVPPVRLDRWAQLFGLNTPVSNLHWRPELGTEVIMMSLDDPSDITRFSIDPFWVWHTTNAYDQDDRVVVDFIRYDDFDNIHWLDGILNKRPDRAANGFPARMVIDPARKCAQVEVISDVACEFPKIAPQFEGRKHHTVWAAAHTSPETAASGMQDALCRLDSRTGSSQIITFGDRDFCSEPLIVPKAGATAEDATWVLSLVYNANQHRSYIGILDGERPTEDPVARVWFDQPIPYTFHGQWLPTIG